MDIKTSFPLATLILRLIPDKKNPRTQDADEGNNRSEK